LKVSIIITVYNYAKYIRRAIDSLLDQEFDKRNYEIIVINDGSTDETSKILEEYQHKIRVINQENVGLVKTCNRGISLAEGGYVIRLDADDSFEKDTIKLLSKALDENKDTGFAYCDYNIITNKRKKRVSLKEYNLFKMVATNIMFRKPVLEEIGGYRDFYFEEYDILIRISKKHKGIYVNRSLLNYFKHDQNMTANKTAWIRGLRQLKDNYGELSKFGDITNPVQYDFDFNADEL